MDSTIALTLIEVVLILLAIAISKAITLISPPHYSCKDTVVDSIPAVSSPSSHIIVAPPAKTKYDVFLSFRGENTRDGFSSHLYEALCDAKLQTFMDHKLHKGDNISPLLVKVIEESEISLIIFSKDYASSTWCMDELVHIMKCKDQRGRIVVPVFYNVDPSSIREQNGSFGDGFAKLKQRFKHNQERVQEWKNALIQSTKLSGWDSKSIRYEAELVKKIVKDILSKLNNKPSFDSEGLVGIGHQIQKIEGLINEARIVGIWGMGGIGKTTLARAVFQKLKEQFEAFSFVENVRERLARIGLDELQEKCLRELLKDEDINTDNLRSNFVKNRLHRKKILLVLDDVDNSVAIEDLIKACGWFGEGSRIIITSRDTQVLKNTSATTTYLVQKLDRHHALRLFSLKAFKQNEPFKSYVELSERAVHYCQGNPLALIVLGCFLHGRGKQEWESALDKLNQALHRDIFNVLKLSFDGLDHTQKNVFLDIAFFLNGAWRISLDCTRSLYGPSAHIEISVLKERSLISVREIGKIEMHALLMDMGLQISRQQLISDPENPTRLWRHEDIYHFFNNVKARIEAVRCVSLDVSKMKRMITWRASDFRKMYNLVFLKVYKSDGSKSLKLNLVGHLDYLSEELRFLSWEEYPLPYVPLHFCAENLVTLKMRNSNIQQFGNVNQHFPNLKAIDLSYSKDLIALPDLTHAPKIEYMHLDGCVSLAQIHSSSNVPRRNVLFVIEDSGPVKINIGGSIIKGTSSSSGLVIVHNYLDLSNFSFNKVTMKVLACGKIISGVGYKHVVMPLGEIAELRKGIRSLGSLLPFVSKLHWIESPIEIGHDFNQHYTYDHHYHPYYRRFDTVFTLKVKVMRGDRGEMINDDQAMKTTTTATVTLMEVEEEEEEEDEELMEYCCNVLTRLVPSSITRWSLLRDLTLKESDIIGSAAGCSSNNDQVSIILKSLIALSQNDDYCRRIKPQIDAKLSLDIPTCALNGYSFRTWYTYLFRHFLFRCNVITYGPLDYHLVVDYLLH